VESSRQERVDLAPVTKRFTTRIAGRAARVAEAGFRDVHASQSSMHSMTPPVRRTRTLTGRA